MKTYATPECAPIMKKNGSRQVCLCVHGFNASPATFVPYVDTISSAGYDVCAPLLPGHGTRYQDMLTVDETDIMNAIGETFEQLAAEYDKVHLLGVSLGGALCAYLAGHYGGTGKVGKVMLLVPCFALRDKKYYSLDYSTVGEDKWPLVQHTYDDPVLAASAFVYEFGYLRSVGQLLRIGDIALGGLESITSPVWILYSANDPVVDPEATEAAARRVKDLRLLKRLDKSGHNILLDDDRPEVLAILDDFLKA